MSIIAPPAELLFIAAPQGDDKPRVYPLETAPIEAFDAWLDAILAAELIYDALFLFTIKAHREDWDAVARWWVVAALALHGVDMRKYYFRVGGPSWLL